MECVPACKTCTGLCQKPAPPRRAGNAVGVTKRKRETVKKAVAPERMAGYIVLVCGTYTTMEEQIATPGFRKSRRRYWCTKHEHWANPYTMAERIAEDQGVPLF